MNASLKLEITVFERLSFICLQYNEYFLKTKRSNKKFNRICISICRKQYINVDFLSVKKISGEKTEDLDF